MEKVMEIINHNALETGNKSGITAVQIAKKAALPIMEVRGILNEIHKAGKVKVREGLNSNLVFAL